MPFNNNGEEVPIWSDDIVAYSIDDALFDLKDKIKSPNTIRNFFESLMRAVLNFPDEVISNMHIDKEYRQYQIPKEIYEEVKILILKDVNTVNRIRKYINKGVPENIFISFEDSIHSMGTKLNGEIFLTYMAVCYIKRNFNIEPRNIEADAIMSAVKKAIEDIDYKYLKGIAKHDWILCGDLMETKGKLKKYEDILDKKIVTYVKTTSGIISNMPDFKQGLKDLGKIMDSYVTLKKTTSFLKTAFKSHEKSIQLIRSIDRVGRDYIEYKNTVVD